MTTPETTVDRIPIGHSVNYAVRGVPEIGDEYNAERTITPTEITLVYRAAPDPQLGRVSAYVKGWWMQDGKRVPMDKPVGRWLYGDPECWPAWLAEEARLHDPDAPTAGVAPATDQTARFERYAVAIHDAMESDLSLIDQEPGLQALFARAAEAAVAVADAEQAELRRERDLAIAHDRQPYPTAWAYEQVCKARTKHQERADAAEAVIAAVRAKHKRRTERHGSGCVQCGIVWPCPTYRELAAVEPSDETQNREPVQHAPGVAIRCPDCRAKGHSVCMDDTEPAAEGVCSDCKGSGLDPRYSAGEYACPDCTPAVGAPQPKGADGDRVVAYRSALPGAWSIYCTRHTDELGNGVLPLTADDLPDGGLCASCGADVLIPQQPKEV